eukprot:GHVN01043317.1.p1 GENE.GHVN01043317.1~~GHVN01043317.1.p1  ORF type:complete len:129 (+),score=5.88 GHVN01043317.1:380-766(+)
MKSNTTLNLMIWSSFPRQPAAYLIDKNPAVTTTFISKMWKTTHNTFKLINDAKKPFYAALKDHIVQTTTTGKLHEPFKRLAKTALFVLFLHVRNKKRIKDSTLLFAYITALRLGAFQLSTVWSGSKNK